MSEGSRYYELTVIKVSGPRRGIFECRCDCGNIVVLPKHRVVSGNTKSCGCRNHRVAREQFKTHGAKVNGKVARTYRIWQLMKNRCMNPKSADYRYYGGRGITFTPNWLRYESFLADMGEAPEGLTLERIDGDKGYYKENCCWATRQAQARNRKYCRPRTYNGQSLYVWEWAEKLGIKVTTLRHRLWQHSVNPNFTLDNVFAKRGGK